MGKKMLRIACGCCVGHEGSEAVEILRVAQNDIEEYGWTRGMLTTYVMLSEVEASQP